jgi:predicted DNA-binding ribbon-helix-helix protein
MAAPFLTKVHAWSEKVQSDAPNHRHAHPSRNHPRHEGYALSQHIRKRIEEVFGWGKAVGPLAQTRLRGTERVGAQFTRFTFSLHWRLDRSTFCVAAVQRSASGTAALCGRVAENNRPLERRAAAQRVPMFASCHLQFLYDQGSITVPIIKNPVWENAMCQIFAGQPQENYESEKRSVRLDGHSTSIQLEKIFWQILEEIAAREAVSLAKFVSKLHDEVMLTHGEARNFASLLRCCCLIYLDGQNPEESRRFGIPAGTPMAVAAE